MVHLFKHHLTKYADKEKIYLKAKGEQKILAQFLTICPRSITNS